LAVGEGGGSAEIEVAGGLEVVGAVVVGAGLVEGGVVWEEVTGRVESCLVGPGGRWMLVKEADRTAWSSASGRSSGFASTVAAPAEADPTRTATSTGSAERFFTRRNVTVRQRTTIG
jgi:hypothetical protein